MFQFDESTDSAVKIQSRRPRPPPKTSTEWLEKNNYTKWPSRVDGEELGNVGWDYNSKEAIAADLMKHARNRTP